MRRAIGPVAGMLVLAVGCTDVELPEALMDNTTTTTTQPDERAEGTTDEGLCVESLRPGEDDLERPVADGSYMADIQEQDELRVGVDVGTPQFSSINPRTGQPEGFDVDIAKEVAKQLDVDIELVGITTNEREAALLAGRVDMVVHNYTMTCERDSSIDFSTEYFRAHQVILVHRDNPATSLEDLAGQRVCATTGSTAIDHIEAIRPEERPLPVEVRQRADCLMLFQQGQVDALATDDAILAGIAAQDPNLVLRDEVFSEEPYGIGLPPDRPEWVRYVNAVLEEVRDGRWQELYDEWLADIPGIRKDPSPPEPTYED